MPGSSNRRLGAQFDAWDLKSTPGSSNRRLAAQIDAWELFADLSWPVEQMRRVFPHVLLI